MGQVAAPKAVMVGARGSKNGWCRLNGETKPSVSASPLYISKRGPALPGPHPQS